MIRRVVIFTVVVILFVAITASASNLSVDGGTIQVFDPDLPNVALPAPTDDLDFETDGDHLDVHAPVADDSTTNQ